MKTDAALVAISRFKLTGGQVSTMISDGPALLLRKGAWLLATQREEENCTGWKYRICDKGYDDKDRIYPYEKDQRTTHIIQFEWLRELCSYCVVHNTTPKNVTDAAIETWKLSSEESCIKQDQQGKKTWLLGS